jgi:hypothetical protein
MAGSFECDNEPSGFINAEDFFDCLSDYYLLSLGVGIDI